MIDYTEDMLVKDLQALQSVIDTFNDLICVVSHSGAEITVLVELDDQGRPQLKMSVEE